jgi:hypothetical protein
MPYFKINADKKPYRLSTIEKRGDQYLIHATRWEQHWRINSFGWGRKVLRDREEHYNFIIPSPKKKLDIHVDNETYICKKADKMTVERLANHLMTLSQLEEL